LAKELDRPLPTLFALSDSNDPFMAGAPARLARQDSRRPYDTLRPPATPQSKTKPHREIADYYTAEAKKKSAARSADRS